MPHYRATTRGDWARPGLRQRAAMLGLALLVQLLAILLVIAFGGARVRDMIAPMAPTSVTFVRAEGEPAPATVQRRQEARDQAKPKAPPAVKTPRPLPPPPVPLPYLPMSSADLAAADIGRFGMTARSADAGTVGQSSARVGEGPGGVTLYAAEWVREPTDAELGGYLPPAVAPGSWALIACQTIAHYQVENCAQLGESPRGSGLSKAMRLAAWQFRVRPPRIDGKPMVGAWVRIRIDFGGQSEAD